MLLFSLQLILNLALAWTRRDILFSSPLIGSIIDTPNPQTSIVLPLEPCAGGVLSTRIRVTSSSTSFCIYSVIVDTGSPYLVVPERGGMEFDSPFRKKHKQKPDYFSDSLYPSTEEVYGAKLGIMEWKYATIDFPRDGRLQPLNLDTSKIVVGVMDDILTEESGGALLGLVKNSNPNANPAKVQLRPTFLQQEGIDTEEEPVLRDVASFCIDAPRRLLTLSNRPLIHASSSSMPLVDLRPLGDFVDHYTVLVQDLILDDVWIYRGGSELYPPSIQKKKRKFQRPVVAVFDTGLTGCVMTRPLWDELCKQSRLQGLSPPGECSRLEITIETKQSKKNKNGGSKRLHSILSGRKEQPKGAPFYVAPIDLDWFDDDETAPHVVVLGQTFLSRGKLTVDIDERVVSFEV